MINTKNNNDLIPLEWWLVNGGKIQHVAIVAQKWLSDPKNSTPSERVFSICGLVDTAKLLNLLGVSIKNKVFRYNNIQQIALTSKI